MPQAANNIDAGQWTLFDKIMYGGLGYGAFCLPTDFFKVIIAILFPPLGEIINIVEDTVTDTFPYFTWETLKLLSTYNALNHIVYSFLLTSLLYIPGLVYTLTNIVNKERKVHYDYSSYIYDNEKLKIASNSSTIDDLKYAGEQSLYGLEYTGEKIEYGFEYAWNNSIGSLF